MNVKIKRLATENEMKEVMALLSEGCYDEAKLLYEHCTTQINVKQKTDRSLKELAKSFLGFGFITKYIHGR